MAKPPTAFPGLSPKAWQSAARTIARTSQVDLEALMTGGTLPIGREVKLRSLILGLQQMYGLTTDEAFVAARALGSTAGMMADSMTQVLGTIPKSVMAQITASAAWMAEGGVPVLLNEQAFANIVSRTTAAITADWTRLATKARGGIVDSLRAAMLGGQGSRAAGLAMYQGVYGQVGLTHARCLTIARTELGDAYQTANLDTYRQGGVTHYRWHANQDARTCALCLALTGTVFPVEQEPETHHNCRCEMLPVFVDDLGKVGADGRWPGTKVPNDTIASRLPSTWKVPDDPRDLVGVTQNPTWRPSKRLVKPV